MELHTSNKRYTDKFKAEAAKQVIDQGRPVRKVAARLGISIDTLCAWAHERRSQMGSSIQASLK